MFSSRENVVSGGHGENVVFLFYGEDAHVVFTAKIKVDYAASLPFVQGGNLKNGIFLGERDAVKNSFAALAESNSFCFVSFGEDYSVGTVAKEEFCLDVVFCFSTLRSGINNISGYSSFGL